MKNNTTAPKSEKQLLVERIQALDPKAKAGKVDTTWSRDDLRKHLKALQSAPQIKITPVPPMTPAEVTKFETEHPETATAIKAAIAKVAPPPAQIELVHEGKEGKGKRYISKTEPDSKYHLRDRSAAEKPVSIVRRICEANLKLERKAILELCLAAGVNKNTAATQYSLWKAAKAKAAAAASDDEGEE